MSIRVIRGHRNKIPFYNVHICYLLSEGMVCILVYIIVIENVNSNVYQYLIHSGQDNFGNLKGEAKELGG